MINNDLNFIPNNPPSDQASVNPIESSSMEAKRMTSSTKSISFPFPRQTNSSSNAESFPIKATFITDSFLNNLENIISTQSQLIEKQIKDMKENTQSTNVNNIIDHLLTEEELASDLLNTTHTTIQEGIDYLDKIFPHAVLNQISKKKDKFKEISKLGTSLLGSLSNGSKNVALICKNKLLDQSKALLQEFKVNFANKLADYHSGQIKKTEEEDMQLKLEKMNTTIHEWASQIVIEEKNLQKEEKDLLSFTDNLLLPSSNFYNGYQSFKFSPQKFILNQLSFLSDFSWLTKGFNVIKGGFDLRAVREENALFSDWKKSYKKWKNENESLVTNKPDEIENPSLKPMIDSSEEHKQNLFETIKTKKFLLARNKLRNCGIELPSTVNTKKTLIDYLETHSNIINQYVEYRQKIETLNHAITTSKNLLEKRHLIVQKKLLLLTPRFHLVVDQLKKIKKEAFTKDLQLTTLNDMQNQLFENWFAGQSKESLMREYIDHQETIELTVKNSLKLMVQQKHKLESHFQKLKSTDTHVQYTMTTLLFATSVTLAILGTLSIPLGGLGFLFLGISIGSTALFVGFLAAGYIYARCFRPQTSHTLTIPFQVQMSIASIRKSIATYFHQSKEKKLMEIAKILHQLHTSSSSKTETERTNNPHYQAALVNYQKAKLNFDKSEEQVKYWEQTLKKYETTVVEAQWKDFSKFAYWETTKKSGSFDMLHSFQEAVKSCDFRFLSAETRYLFEAQLGINLEQLQNEMRKDPDAVKNAMQSFFSLTDTKLFDFIRNQQARISKGVITGSPFA